MTSYAANQEGHIEDTPSLDPERLESLRSLCGDDDPALFADLLSSWARESANRLQEIHQSWASGDQTGLRAAAHALHGICSSTGVLRLSEYSQHLENAGSPLSAVAPIIAAMDEELRQVRDVLCPARAAEPPPERSGARATQTVSR